MGDIRRQTKEAGRGTLRFRPSNLPKDLLHSGMPLTHDTQIKRKTMRDPVPSDEESSKQSQNNSEEVRRGSSGALTQVNEDPEISLDWDVNRALEGPLGGDGFGDLDPSRPEGIAAFIRQFQKLQDDRRSHFWDGFYRNLLSSDHRQRNASLDEFVQIAYLVLVGRGSRARPENVPQEGGPSEVEITTLVPRQMAGNSVDNLNGTHQYDEEYWRKMLRKNHKVLYSERISKGVDVKPVAFVPPLEFNQPPEPRATSRKRRVAFHSTFSNYKNRTLGAHGRVQGDESARGSQGLRLLPHPQWPVDSDGLQKCLSTYRMGRGAPSFLAGPAADLQSAPKAPKSSRVVIIPSRPPFMEYRNEFKPIFSIINNRECVEGLEKSLASVGLDRENASPSALRRQPENNKKKFHDFVIETGQIILERIKKSEDKALAVSYKHSVVNSLVDAYCRQHWQCSPVCRLRETFVQELLRAMKEDARNLFVEASQVELGSVSKVRLSEFMKKVYGKL